MQNVKNFSYLCFILVVNCDTTLETYIDKEFKIFYTKFAPTSINLSLAFPAWSNLSSDEIALNFFSGQFWKHLNSSVDLVKDFQIIDLTKSDESFFEFIEWLEEINRQYQLDIRPVYLHELYKNENIGIRCPLKQRSAYWYKMNYQQNEALPLRNTHRLRLNNDTMYINGFLQSDSGAYFCLSEKISLNFNYTTISPVIFFLLLKYPLENRKEIIDTTKSELVKLTKDLFSFEKLRKDVYLDEPSQLAVYTLWQEWSLCGNCNRTSLRNRLGNCHIVLNKTSKSSLQKELNVMQRLFYPNGGACHLGVYFEYLSEKSARLDIFNNYNHYDLCNLDCKSYESVRDEKSVYMNCILSCFVLN